MATLYSNELKAVVVQDNFLENPLNVMKENCQTVQHFDYRCEHRRNEAGDLYGVSEPVLLNFSVRIGSPRDGRPYYRAMAANEHYRFSFIFNATFNSMAMRTEWWSTATWYTSRSSRQRKTTVRARTGRHCSR